MQSQFRLVAKHVVRGFNIKFSALLIGVSGLTHAAQSEQVHSSTPQVEIYQSNSFMAAKPQTLYDVLQDIPGANNLLNAITCTDVRGFGSSGDQILINKKRVSGKENDLEKELKNIQAKDVDYVELIRGTRADLDVQSEGLIVNVMLKDNIESALLYSATAIKSSDLNTKFRGSVTYSDAIENLKYRIGVSRYVNPTKIHFDDTYTTAQNEITDTYARIRNNWYTEDQLTAKLEYALSDNTQLQTNLLLAKIYVDADFSIAHNNTLQTAQDEKAIIYDWDQDKWELSGDFTHSFDSQNQLKIVFISNKLDANDQVWRYLVNDGNVGAEDYRLPRLYTSTENVLRSNWQHDVDDKHSFNSGFEIAINSRDENLQFIRQPDNRYHSTEVNDIKETRYEGFINYNFAVSPKVNFQSSLVYEHSKMDVQSDFLLTTDSVAQNNLKSQSSRTFSYLKPRLNLRYDISDVYQLRFNYQRTVSQLNLDDFVPEFNRDEIRLEETNPNLKPEVRDKFSISLEKQWTATDGSIAITPYYHDINDLITEVPLTSYSGDGNVASAKEYGVEITASFGLDVFGLDNTLINTTYTLRDSEVTNPFTGMKSEIEKLTNHQWSVNINQKELLPGLSLNLTLSDKSDYPYSRYDYIARHSDRMTLSGFLDYQINSNFKLRLQGNQLLRRKSSYTRERHDGLYTETDFKRYETRHYERAPRILITLSGQF